MARQTKQERFYTLLAQAASEGLWDFVAPDGKRYEVCYTCKATGMSEASFLMCPKCGGAGCREAKPAPPKFDVDSEHAYTRELRAMGILNARA